MDEGALKRIGAMLGAVVAGGVGLCEGFCGLVLGHCTWVVERSTTLAGSTGPRLDEMTGGAARLFGTIWLLMAGAVVYAAVRTVRETS